MRIHTFTAFCVGVILTIGSMGAQSDGRRLEQGAAVESVDRTLKADRLPFVKTGAAREQSVGLQLPEGCEALVSPLAHRQLARIAAHCES
jgi:hypothetical protein